MLHANKASLIKLHFIPHCQMRKDISMFSPPHPSMLYRVSLKRTPAKGRRRNCKKKSKTHIIVRSNLVKVFAIDCKQTASHCWRTADEKKKINSLDGIGGAASRGGHALLPVEVQCPDVSNRHVHSALRALLQKHPDPRKEKQMLMGKGRGARRGGAGRGGGGGVGVGAGQTSRRCRRWGCWATTARTPWCGLR